MGRIEKLKSAELDYENNEEEQVKQSKSPIMLSSDDEEANEDLSLKIVEKAMLRACTTTTSRKSKGGSERGVGSIGAINLSSTPSSETELVTNVKDEKKKRKKKEKKTIKKIEMQDDADAVNVSTEAEKEEKCESKMMDETVEINPVEKSDNVVLRKLLRGPRYFDPPDSGWGACYNCGEEGHTTVNCTSARRKKPCFVCGSFDHNAKQCTKGQDCFICKKGGHRAKDCPEKYTSSPSDKICLKCGQSGHEMFSCKNDYSPDDLEEIQCYICKRFGHLCCVNYTGSLPREISCYRCGQSGHTGLACSGSHGETTSMGSISSCYRCGEEGHFARECTNSTKSAKRNRELSTPTRSIRENREIFEARSAPNALGKARKRKKNQYEGEFGRTSSPQSKQWGVWNTEDTEYTKSPISKQRGGWITEDPGDFPRRKAKASGWGSTSTPTNRSNNKMYNNSSAGDHASSSRPRKGHKLLYGSPASNFSRSYQQRFSASRFGNSSGGDGMRRNYDW